MTAERPQHAATMSRRSCGCESCHSWRHRLCVVMCDFDCPAPPMTAERQKAAERLAYRQEANTHA